MALLHVAVSDEDKELVGQRTLPLNAIRPGFRHIWLRDKHNSPLPLSMLFVKISVEDWVPDEMEGMGRHSYELPKQYQWLEFTKSSLPIYIDLWQC